MPELPEVETIVRELRAIVPGKKFMRMRAYFKPVLKPSARYLSDNIRGLEVLDVGRRGKFIIFVLSGDMRMVVHLRMTGRLTWETAENRKKFVRASFYFTDGTVLNFSDVRKFARIWLYAENDFEKLTGISRLGPEPLEMSLKEFMELFQGKRGILKNTLLRQDVIAGIGNIYADEICHEIGLHPASRLEKVGNKKYREMYSAIKTCLRAGIKHCGVSVSDFAGTRGDLGRHQHYLKVYGRGGEKCHACSSPIRKTRVAGRGTYYCPKCQPAR